MANTSFLSLPYELRAKIYNHHFANSRLTIPILYQCGEWSLPTDFEAQIQGCTRQASILLASRQIHAELITTFWSLLPVRLEPQNGEPSEPIYPPKELGPLIEDVEFLRRLTRDPRIPANVFSKTLTIYSPLGLISAWHYMGLENLTLFPSLRTIVFSGPDCTLGILKVDGSHVRKGDLWYNTPRDLEMELKRHMTFFRMTSGTRPLTTVVQRLAANERSTCRVMASPKTEFRNWHVEWIQQ